ncbi:MAG: hypothetical protein ACRDBL_07730 [Rhabdaerophilum sp.]
MESARKPTTFPSNSATRSAPPGCSAAASSSANKDASASERSRARSWVRASSNRFNAQRRSITASRSAGSMGRIVTSASCFMAVRRASAEDQAAALR